MEKLKGGLKDQNEVGEIIVKGPNVTEEYWANDSANTLAKIRDTVTNEVWHRMGDLGKFDKSGRLWFYGRKAQRVVTSSRTYFTIPVETIFNQHPAVERSALVGIKKGDGTEIVSVICIEPAKNEKRKIYLHDELRSMASDNDVTRGIKDFLFHRKFPVDPRHNAKIFREKLAIWAAFKL